MKLSAQPAMPTATQLERQLVESWSTAVVITSIGITRHSWWTPFARLPRPRVGDQQLGGVVGMDHGARSARYC